MRSRRSGPNWRLFLGLALALLALQPALNNSSDGGAMLDVTQRFVSHGSIDVPCSSNTVQRPDGRCFSTFYLLQSVALVPFVVAGRALGAAAGTSASFTGEVIGMALPALATALAGMLIAALARERGAGPRPAVLAALAYVAGTESLTITRSLFAEPLAAACLILCVWGLLATSSSGRARRAAGFAGAALVVMAKPQLLVAVPLAALALSLRDRRPRPLAVALAGTALGSIAVLAYNWQRFGAPFDFGGATRKLYVGGAPGGSPVLDLLDGAASLLVSPNHGLLLFAPVALLGIAGLLRRPLDRVASACLGGAAGVYAFAVIVPDGQFWGTRYLVPLLPLACVGVAGLGVTWKRVAIGLVIVVALSQAPNLVSYPERVKHPVREAGQIRAKWPGAWDLHHLALADVWPAAARQLRAARETDAASLVHAEPEGRLMRVVAQWWWMLPALGIPALLGAGVALLMLIGGALLVLRSAQEIGRPR